MSRKLKLYKVWIRPCNSGEYIKNCQVEGSSKLDALMSASGSINYYWTRSYDTSGITVYRNNHGCGNLQGSVRVDLEWKNQQQAKGESK